MVSVNFFSTWRCKKTKSHFEAIQEWEKGGRRTPAREERHRRRLLGSSKTTSTPPSAPSTPPQSPKTRSPNSPAPRLNRSILHPIQHQERHGLHRSGIKVESLLKDSGPRPKMSTSLPLFLREGFVGDFAGVVNASELADLPAHYCK